jgi:hypothetical protein
LLEHTNTRRYCCSGLIYFYFRVIIHLVCQSFHDEAALMPCSTCFRTRHKYCDLVEWIRAHVFLETTRGDQPRVLLLGPNDIIEASAPCTQIFMPCCNTKYGLHRMFNVRNRLATWRHELSLTATRRYADRYASNRPDLRDYRFELGFGYKMEIGPKL